MIFKFLKGNVMKKVIVILFIITLGLIGCQVIQDKLTPAKVPDELASYAGKDPNKIGFQSLEKLKDVKLAADIKHISSQADWSYFITKDNKIYEELAQKAAEYREQAERDKKFMFGAEGLVTVLLGLFGGGSVATSITALYKNNTMYSETEVAEIKAGTNKTIS